LKSFLDNQSINHAFLSFFIENFHVNIGSLIPHPHQMLAQNSTLVLVATLLLIESLGNKDAHNKQCDSLVQKKRKENTISKNQFSKYKLS
jgi:hypothetical protein